MANWTVESCKGLQGNSYVETILVHIWWKEKTQQQNPLRNNSVILEKIHGQWAGEKSRLLTRSHCRPAQNCPRRAVRIWGASSNSKSSATGQRLPSFIARIQNPGQPCTSSVGGSLPRALFLLTCRLPLIRKTLSFWSSHTSQTPVARPCKDWILALLLVSSMTLGKLLKIFEPQFAVL